MSTRQSIVDAVGVRLATATGFDADHVHEWRRQTLQISDLPAVVYADGTDKIEPPAYGVIGHVLEITVEIVATGSSVADDLRTHAENVLAVIGTDTTWGALAESTVLAGIDLEIDETDRKIGAASIAIAINYETALWAM